MHEITELFRIVDSRERPSHDRQHSSGLRFALLLLVRCPFDALHMFTLSYLLKYGFEAMSAGDAARLTRVCIYFGLASIMLFLYNGTVWTLYSTYSARLVATLKKRLFNHVSRLTLQTIEARDSGEWFTRLNADIQSAAALVNQGLQLPHAACAIVLALVSSVVLWIISPEVFLLVIAFTIPHILISRLFIARSVVKLSAKVQAQTARNSSELSSLLVCKDTALIYDAQNMLFSRFEQSSLELRRTQMKLRIREALGNALLPLLALSGYLVILFCGSAWIAAGATTFGDLTAAFQFRGGILKGAMMFSSCIVNIRASFAGVKRVSETLKMNVENET